MAYIGWRFPPLCGGNRQGYTKNDIETFKGEELIDNLAREICQNSLDAKRKGITEPVKVVFELKKAPSHGLEVFDGYRRCIEGCRRCWGDKMDPKLRSFLDNADQMLLLDEIPILVASDYQTEGLPGSRSRNISSAWEALTGSDGVSVKASETSGGSFGVGKNAPFACSALSVVFYNTYATDEEKAFIGVGKMATIFNEQGKETQGVGKYQVNDDEAEKWLPIFEDSQDDFRDMFTRTEHGTDVIIVGFTQVNDWMKSVEKAILKNFFVAISEGRLVVELKGHRKKLIDADTISQSISDYDNDPEMIVTAQLYKAYSDPDKKEFLSIIEENDAEVFIKSESSYNRVIANFRDTGMLIGQKSRRIFQHYAAVFIVRGQSLGELLRATEPARHNKWDAKLIQGSSVEEKEKRKQARKAIRDIDNSVLELLKSQFEAPTETTVDAAGVGEYIPDDMDDMGGASEGNDILKTKIKIGKVKTVVRSNGTTTVTGVKEEGTEQKGDVHNERKNPTPPPTVHRPRVVDPEKDGEQKQGAAPGKGTKTVTLPNLLKQRAFPISSSQGLYKIVVVPQETYNNLFVECLAMGEDGKTDTLSMETFTYNGTPVKIQGGKAGPMKVEANSPATFYVRFTSKEKMVLSLHLTEVVNK